MCSLPGRIPVFLIVSRRLPYHDSGSAIHVSPTGFLLSRDYQPFCDDCVVPLTVKHFLVECPSLVDLRNRFLYRCRDADGVFHLTRVLGPACLSPGYQVLHFLEEAGLLQRL